MAASGSGGGGGGGGVSREGSAKATVADRISQAVQSTSNLLHLMQESSPSQAELIKLPKNLFAKVSTIKNTGQVLDQLPRVISSLDAYMESSLHSAPQLKTVTQLLSHMENSQLKYVFPTSQQPEEQKHADSENTAVANSSSDHGVFSSNNGEGLSHHEILEYIHSSPMYLILKSARPTKTRATALTTPSAASRPNTSSALEACKKLLHGLHVFSIRHRSRQDKAEMKCTRHPLEGGVGVCAACLRERLLALTATAASEAHSPEQQRRKPFPQPPSALSLQLPRSASRVAVGSRRSSILSTIFCRYGSGDRYEKPRRSRSCLMELLGGSRRKKIAAEPEGSGGGWPEPSSVRRATMENRHHHNHQGGGLAGFAVCFSPLVTASHSRWRSRVTELGFPSEKPGAALGPYHRRRATTGGPLLFPDRSGRLAEHDMFR
ncbi:unnamed protein product [Musa banksii]